jgi:hypothetical protein
MTMLDLAPVVAANDLLARDKRYRDKRYIERQAYLAVAALQKSRNSHPAYLEAKLMSACTF